MTVVVRLADLDEDRESIISGMREHLNPLTNEARFNWLYADNPDGEARIWVIVDPETNEIVGSSGTLPRYFFVAGEKVLGCVITDTWVHPDYRALGPALKLQRACMTDITPSRFALAYDFPRQSMPAIYKRLRIEPRDSLVEFVGLLRFDSFLENRLGGSAPVRGLSGIANLFLRLMEPSVRQRDVIFRIEQGPFGSEFTEFHEENVGKTLCVARSAEYINWRYHGHFNHKHEFLVARRHEKLAGYVVFVDDPLRATVVDIVSENGEMMKWGLLRTLMRLLRKRGCQQVQCSALSGDLTATVLRKLGFREQRETPFVLIPAKEFEEQVADMPCSFMLGHEAD